MLYLVDDMVYHAALQVIFVPSILLEKNTE